MYRIRIELNGGESLRRGGGDYSLNDAVNSVREGIAQYCGPNDEIDFHEVLYFKNLLQLRAYLSDLCIRVSLYAEGVAVHECHKEVFVGHREATRGGTTKTALRETYGHRQCLPTIERQ